MYILIGCILLFSNKICNFSKATNTRCLGMLHKTKTATCASVIRME